MIYRIGHIADLQVKNRNNNLFRSYESGLDDIIKIVESEKLISIVIAGDFFEFEEPSDSERKLIYNFLSRLTTIDTLQEIAFIIGNHDEIKEKRKQTKGDSLQNDINIGYNPVNIFVDLINHLDTEKASKFLYMNESKVYDSKISDKIKYIAYSLEDKSPVNFEGYDPQKRVVYFPVYHGMLKEYVELRKLPVRKDIVERLDSLDIFPEHTNVLAGDIHENLMLRDNKRDVNFHYCGSTQQHTHSEGNYIKVTSKILYDTIAQKKCVKVHNVNVDDLTDTVEDLTIKDFVAYHTIILDGEQPYDVIKENITRLMENLSTSGDLGLYQNFFEIKSSSSFISKEMELFDIINNCSHNKQREYASFKINFSYDKITKMFNDVETNVKNEIVKEVMSEVVANNENMSQEEMMEMTLTPENVKDLILSNKQVEKLFAGVLENQMKSLKDFDEDLSKDNVKSEIKILFEKELSVAMVPSKKYDVVFKDIHCTSFMSLGENFIELDIPGIVRILGTNGIGKTTLFRMVRWMKSGEVFDWMKSNQVNKNNLVVFNKNLDVDKLSVSLNVTVNNIPVRIVRTVERKWKTNTTDENKHNPDWKEYVAEVNKFLKIVINEGKENEKVVSGDNAQTNIDLWFGQNSMDMMFVNVTFLENLIKSQPEKLNEDILNIIGVEYIVRLENNLPNVKKEIETVLKPKMSKDDIKMIKIDLIVAGERIEKEIKSSEFEREDITKDATKSSEKLKVLNDRLVDIGNIPDLVKTSEIELYSVDNAILNFVVKTKLEKIPFTEIKPIKNEEKANELTVEIQDINSRIVNLESSKVASLEMSKKRANDYVNSVEALKSKFEEMLNKDKLALKGLKEDVSIVYKSLRDTLQFQYDVDDKRYKEEDEKRNGIKNAITNAENDIFKLEESIKSGVCSKCSRAFDEKEHAKHKEESTLAIEKLQEFLVIENKKLKELVDELAEMSKFNYSTLKILNKSKYEDVTLFDDTDVYKVQKSEIESLTLSINQLNLNITKVDNLMAEAIKTPNALIALDSKTFFEKYNNYINKDCKENAYAYYSSIELIKNIEKELEDVRSDLKIKESLLKNMNDAYMLSLERYQKLYASNISENEKVDDENVKIENHNRSISELQTKKQIIESTIEQHKKNLPIYELAKLSRDEQEIAGKELSEKLRVINQSITKLYLDKQENETKVKANNKLYDDYLEYQKNNIIWTIYSKLIKNNFKEIIFEYYRTFLNNTLNSLLSDVNFKLFWDSNSQLYMITFKDGKRTFAPANQSSGMETVFLGLSIVYTEHLLNVKNSVSHIFIDELSGSLNKGDLTTYESLDYQTLFVKMLNKFKDKSVFVIDHSIKNMFETLTYEVSYNDEGNKYTKLSL